MRVLVFVVYDGSCFYGSAPQKDRFTFLGFVESILSTKGIRFSNLSGSSRTDRGVHALGSSFHFDIEGEFWNEEKVKDILNSSSRGMFYISKVFFVKNDFHSRYAASKRSYRYIFSDSVTPFERNYVSCVEEFDIEYMKSLAWLFEGEHDFSFFKKEGSDTKSSKREIYKVRVYKYGKYGVFSVEGNGFLRSQVRLMVAFLLSAKKLGLGEIELKKQLLCQKKYITKPASPAGLYLRRVYYEQGTLF
ncbi:MAG: tRNA pseudouridine(38-40) synthase TruA [Campylobacterales bacterium]